MTDKLEQQYREWLGERIEGMTGTLESEDRLKGVWHLNTESLEKVYKALWKLDPKKEFEADLERWARKNLPKR